MSFYFSSNVLQLYYKQQMMNTVETLIDQLTFIFDKNFGLLLTLVTQIAGTESKGKKANVYLYIKVMVI